MLEFITRAEAERMIREALDARAQEQLDSVSAMLNQMVVKRREDALKTRRERGTLDADAGGDSS